MFILIASAYSILPSIAGGLGISIKLSDRSHNVEDLYNMSPNKLHKYIAETRKYIYSLAEYGKRYYPEYSNAFYILKNKIVSLTEASEAIIDIFEKKE